MCENKSCNLLASFIGVIIAVIVAIAVYTGTISAYYLEAPLALMALIATAIFIAVMIIASKYVLLPRSEVPACFCSSSKWTISISAISIILSIAGLLVSEVFCCEEAAIPLGIVSGVFVTAIISSICWILCLIQNKYSCKNECKKE